MEFLDRINKIKRIGKRQRMRNPLGFCSGQGEGAIKAEEAKKQEQRAESRQK